MDQSSMAKSRLSDDFNEIDRREYNMYLKRQEILKKQQQQHMKDMKNAINLNNSSKLNQSKKSKTSINMASSILQLDPDDKNILSQLVINDEQRTQKTKELRQQEREQKLRAKIEEKKQKLKNERELKKLRNRKQFEIKNPDNNVILNSSIKKNYNDNLKNSAISVKSVRFQNINKSEQIIEELSEFESQITESELNELQNQFTQPSKKKKKKKKKEKPEKNGANNINLDMISPGERYKQIRPTLLMGVSDKDKLFQNIQKRLENEEQNQDNEYEDDSDESSIKTQDISSVELTSESEYEEEEDYIKQKDFKLWQQYQKEQQIIKEKQNSGYEDELQQTKSLSQKNKERIQLIQSINNTKANRATEIQQQQDIQKFNLNENLSIPQKDTFFLRSTEKLFQIQEDEIKQKLLVEKNQRRDLIQQRKQFVIIYDKKISDTDVKFEISTIKEHNKQIALNLLQNKQQLKKVCMESFNTPQQDLAYLNYNQMKIALEQFFIMNDLQKPPIDPEKDENQIENQIFNMHLFFNMFENRTKIYYHDYFYYIQRLLQILSDQYVYSKQVLDQVDIISHNKDQIRQDSKKYNYYNQFGDQPRFGPGF